MLAGALVFAGRVGIGSGELGKRLPRSENRSWTRCAGLVVVLGTLGNELTGTMPRVESRPPRTSFGRAEGVNFGSVIEVDEVSGNRPILESRPPRISLDIELRTEVVVRPAVSDVLLLRFPRPARRSSRISSMSKDLVELSVWVKPSMISSSEKRSPKTSPGAECSVELGLTVSVIVGLMRTFSRPDNKPPITSAGIVVGTDVVDSALSPRYESILSNKSSALVDLGMVGTVELGCSRMSPTSDNKPPRKLDALLVDVAFALRSVVDAITPTPRSDRRPPIRLIALPGAGFTDPERVELPPRRFGSNPSRSCSVGPVCDEVGKAAVVIVGVAKLPIPDRRSSSASNARVACTKIGSDKPLSTLFITEKKSSRSAMALVACGRFEMFVGLTPVLAAENRSSKISTALVTCGRIGMSVIVGRLLIMESIPPKGFPGFIVRLGVKMVVVVGSSSLAPSSESNCPKRSGDDAVGNKPGTRGVAAAVADEPEVTKDLDPKPRAENRSPNTFGETSVLVWRDEEGEATGGTLLELERLPTGVKVLKVEPSPPCPSPGSSCPKRSSGVGVRVLVTVSAETVSEDV
jgi:hypothetical protein